ncbi:MAG: TetR/AcrR family transcriptional regulator [Acidimicrobiales bacterium]
MSSTSTDTRERIVLAAQDLLARTASSAIRVVDIAGHAHVGVPTIYYHFASREQVIAQAQLRTYGELSRPMTAFVTRMSEALVDGNAEGFRHELLADVVTTWEAGALEEEVGVMRLLLDIWADPPTRQEFRDTVARRYRHWVRLMEQAQQRGWVQSAPHAATGVAVFWAASVGLAVLPHEPDLGVTPQRVAELCWGLISGSPVG